MLIINPGQSKQLRSVEDLLQIRDCARMMVFDDKSGRHHFLFNHPLNTADESNNICQQILATITVAEHRYPLTILTNVVNNRFVLVITSPYNMVSENPLIHRRYSPTLERRYNKETNLSLKAPKSWMEPKRDVIRTYKYDVEYVPVDKISTRYITNVNGISYYEFYNEPTYYMSRIVCTPVDLIMNWH